MRSLQWEQGWAQPFCLCSWSRMDLELPGLQPWSSAQGETEAGVLCSVLRLAKNKEQAGSPCLYRCQPGALKTEIKYSKT